MIADAEELAYVDPQGPWAGLRGVARVTYQRGGKGGTSEETRYYISRYPANADTLLRATRAHWCIENSLPWVLDMVFNEDHSRVRTGYADQNWR